MYAQGESNPTYSGKSIPGPSLIRIPEMYYIVAEANLTKDPDKATEYLDYVVKSRDLTNAGRSFSPTARISST